MDDLLAILWQELRIDRKNDARPFFLWKKDAKLLKGSLSHGKRSNENEKKKEKKNGQQKRYNKNEKNAFHKYENVKVWSIIAISMCMIFRSYG